MKLVSLFVLLGFIGCSHDRGPASVSNPNEAFDKIAGGNIQASAVKSKNAGEVCFDVQLKMKGIPQSEATTSNWNVAWVDKEDKFHLLTLNQRDPASTEPKGGIKTTAYGAWEEWTNAFRTCAPQTTFDNVKSLVITPKELSYKESESLNLEWK